VAATIFAALGILACWLTIGDGATNIAFANVAKVLDSLRSATFDLSFSAVKGEGSGPTVDKNVKGYFLAPMRDRTENCDGMKYSSIMVIDGRVGKCLMLLPDMKLAIPVDLKKVNPGGGALLVDVLVSVGRATSPIFFVSVTQNSVSAQFGTVLPEPFEMIRRLVSEGNSGTGEKVEKLGSKEIDGRKAVGFHVRVGTADMVLWADPKTAFPVRIETTRQMSHGVRHSVMSNFRWNVSLDPSLFSLEPPAGYSTQAVVAMMPVEEDLPRTLRTIAEHNKDVFPARLGTNDEVTRALRAGLTRKLDKDEKEKLEAAIKKLEVKYGNAEQFRAKYGENMPSEVLGDIMDTYRPLMKKPRPGVLEELQKRYSGVAFYESLDPENDPHYVGGGVKRGTPGRPILWYKPWGGKKYRVIYADLSVKEMTAEDVKKLEKAK
jgi:outer membrane lipoprotein-sorting protein